MDRSRGRAEEAERDERRGGMTEAVLPTGLQTAESDARSWL